MKKQREVIPNINIENARIGFRNFAGLQGKYNAAGNRNFCVFLEEEVSDRLLADGWNVRCLKPVDPEDPKQCYIQVAIAFGDYPPKVVQITKAGKTLLDVDSINILDWADISSVDIVIRPYEWDVNGKQGVKAYVKSMYVTLAEDEFESKYIDVPDSAMNAPKKYEVD